MKRLSTLFFFLAFLTAAQAQYSIGDKVEDFKLKNVDGKMVSMSDFQSAKGFIVVFTCNHCPYAKMYEDRIIKLHKSFSKEYPVIAISSNDANAYPSDSYKNMQKRAKSKGFKFPYLYDESQDIAKAFGATRTPHVFLVDKNKMQLAYIGAIDDNARSASDVKVKYLEDAISSLKKGKKPDPSTTKAIGCSIKWK